VRQQLLAGDGEALDAAPPRAAALHEPGAGQGLELGQGLGHRRLAQRQPLGRARQMALLRHCHQAAQVPQLHIAQEDVGLGRHSITNAYEKTQERQFTSATRMNRVDAIPTNPETSS
jgi:hypothetical protein